MEVGPAQPDERQGAPRDRGERKSADVVHGKEMHARIAPERLLWCVKRRMPSRATRSGRMVGMTSPMLASSAGSSPDKAASDMPCTFPLVLVDGVFMSARASTQATLRGPSYGPGGHAVVAPPPTPRVSTQRPGQHH